MNRGEMGYEDGRWMELAQDHVQWRDLVIAVSNLRVLLAELQLIRKTKDDLVKVHDLYYCYFL
jgi:hypothetical protein